MKTLLKNWITASATSLLALLFLPSTTLAVPGGISIQGRLLNNGIAVESASVVVTLKVTSQGASECTLFEETQSLNMTASDGVMALTLGQGTRTSNDKGLSVAQVFSNKPTTQSGLNCTSGGSSYTPSNADSRNVYITFNDNGTVVALSSPFAIQSVPYALEADSLSGKASTDFLQVTTDTTQSRINALTVPTTYNELIALAGGTSTQYATTSGGSFSGDVNLNSHKLTNLTSPSASTDAANKNYVDTTLGTKALDSTTIAALNNSTDSGKVLSWNGTTWTASVPASDATKLPLSGGTMSGAIAMGLNNILNAGYLTQGANKYLQFGNLTDAQETTLVATPLTSAYAGATWFNVTSNQLKYWDGSVVKTMSSSFPAQTANLVFAGPASGGSAVPSFRSVVEADVPNLTASGKVANSATTAASSNTANAIVARDSSGNFAATNATLTKTVLNDTQSTPNTVSLQAPSTVTTSYVLKMPAALTGTSGFVLSSDTSGNLSWIAPSTGSVTSVGATAPVASTGGSTPTISIAKATGSVDGYLAATDFTTFNAKLNAALTGAHLFVGNASNVATDVAASGDVAVTNAGSFTVNGVKGKSVSATPTTAGQVLRYDGTSWTPNYVSMTDLRSTVTGASSATTCTAGQTLTYTSVADNLSCTTIALSDSQITYASQAANKFFASPNGSSGAPTYRSITTADLPVTGTGGAFVNGGNAFGAASSLGSTDANNLNLMTNNANRMSINSAGNVGIGTTAPSGTLDVQGGTSSTGAGVPINMVAQNALGGTTSLGGSINLTAGDSSVVTSGGVLGGAINIKGGKGAWVSSSTTLGKGGPVTVQAGQGASTSQGGDLLLSGGLGGSTSGLGGNVFLSGGTPIEGGGGQTSIRGGLAVSSSGTGSYNGGDIFINPGDGVAAGKGGSLYIGGGNGNGAANSGGKIMVNGGNDGNSAFGPILLATSGGSVGIGTTSPGGKLDVNQTTAGSIALQGQNAGTAFWKVLNPAGGATNTWNAANAIEYVGKDTGTNRSINAAGTINASGADFAEWVDWTGGAKPEMGSVVLYRGSYVVVSSPFTAAFIGNDIKDPDHAILVAFAGQLPVLIRGQVHEGDLIVANDDGTARAVAKADVTLAMAQKAVGTAWASSNDPGLKRVNVAVGIGLSGGGARDIASLKAKDAEKDQKIKNLEQENAAIKAYLCSKDKKAAICK